MLNPSTFSVCLYSSVAGSSDNGWDWWGDRSEEP
jgi:hypothetical protein